MKDTEIFKGLFGLLGIWVTWIYANLATVQTWASIIASLSAIVASIGLRQGKRSSDKMDGHDLVHLHPIRRRHSLLLN